MVLEGPEGAQIDREGHTFVLHPLGPGLAQAFRGSPPKCIKNSRLFLVLKKLVNKM